jgi:hypothetical protein
MSTTPAPMTPDAPLAADASPAPDRVRHVVTEGLKAVGFTAGGVAAGAVLESRAQLSRKLPISRRRSRRRAIRKAIARRLP